MTQKKEREKNTLPAKVKPLTPNDILKFEIAQELGLNDKIEQGGWKSLTSRESGMIGGIISKRKRQKGGSQNP